MAAYIGRFAPSPTGLLHAGSLVAALASWLDARAHGGLWRVRIEDVDTPRCVAGAGEAMLAQLARCGLVPDGEVLWQSQRGDAYQEALDLCVYSRQQVERTGLGAWRTIHNEAVGLAAAILYQMELEKEGA